MNSKVGKDKVIIEGKNLYESQWLDENQITYSVGLQMTCTIDYRN